MFIIFWITRFAWGLFQLLGFAHHINIHNLAVWQGVILFWPRFGPDNGHTTFNTEAPIPEQVSLHIYVRCQVIFDFDHIVTWNNCKYCLFDYYCSRWPSASKWMWTLIVMVVRSLSSLQITCSKISHKWNEYWQKAIILKDFYWTLCPTMFYLKVYSIIILQRLAWWRSAGWMRQNDRTWRFFVRSSSIENRFVCYQNSKFGATELLWMDWRVPVYWKVLISNYQSVVNSNSE